MSIRIGVYDFFSYTLSGVLYISIFIFGLVIFNVIQIDSKLLLNTSLFTFLMLAVFGYFIGLLMDHIAYKWLRLLKGGNEKARRNALKYFHKNHPWLNLNVGEEDWSILFQSVKKKSGDMASAIDQHNAISLLLRNVSLGLALLATILFLFFIVVSPNVWYLLLSLLSLLFSSIAIKRCETRRYWFYSGVFEAFSVLFLINEKELGRFDFDMLRNANTENEQSEK